MSGWFFKTFRTFRICLRNDWSAVNVLNVLSFTDINKTGTYALWFAHERQQQQGKTLRKQVQNVQNLKVSFSNTEVTLWCFGERALYLDRWTDNLVRILG